MIAIRNLELDVGAPLPTESLLRLLPELFDKLDAVHLPGQLREDCSLIAETSADLEDSVIGADIKRSINATINGCEIVLLKPIGRGRLA